MVNSQRNYIVENIVIDYPSIELSALEEAFLRNAMEKVIGGLMERRIDVHNDIYTPVEIHDLPIEEQIKLREYFHL